MTVTGLSDDGIASLEFGPNLAAYVVALDRFQTFSDENDAFSIVDAGCNVFCSFSNYSPGTAVLTSYYTRLGPKLYSAETTMSNFRYYSPHVLLQDDHVPPNRRILRMPDTVTFDQIKPVLGVTDKPFADHASSNAPRVRVHHVRSSRRHKVHCS